MASPPARRSGLHPQAWSMASEARRALSPPRHALEQGYGAGVKSTSSGGRAVSLTSGVTLGKSLSAQASVCFLTEPSAGAPCGAEGVCANMHVPCVCAHVYAQTVHTLASHEMFISYVDVQTCMARKTPSPHVHRMGVAQWVQGAWALGSLLPA